MVAPKRYYTGHKKQPLDYSRPLWERQEGEPPRAYEVFLNYRDSDPRVVGDHPNGYKRSSVWSWSERVQAWDQYMVKMEDEALVRYRLTMNERHRTIARLAQARAAEWLQKLTGEAIARMRPSDVARLLEVSTRIEREASRFHDEADLTVDVSQVTSYTQEETMQRLAQLQQEIQRRMIDRQVEGTVVEGQVVDDYAEEDEEEKDDDLD